MSSERSPLPFVLSSGQAAHVLNSDGDKTTVRSPVASPPGSTLRGKAAEIDQEFQLKVRSCRKIDGLFVIDGRSQNATRALRAWLRGS
jgi:hypothetical protein